MKNINKGNTMKTTNKMLLGVAVTLALTTAGYATCATHVDMGSYRVTNVADPVNSKDVVNKRTLEAYMYETMKNKYIRDNAKEVVLDVSTNLMWQDNAAAATTQKQWVTTANFNAGNYFDTSGDTATTYCTNLSLGGYTDWYLPSEDELLSIVKSTASTPAISNIFQHTASGYYWSTTITINYKAWSIDFEDGSQYNVEKDISYYVRCVRAGQ